MTRFLQTAAVFPLLVIILLAVTFVAVYVISVGKGDVDPIFPYISDCAALYPQSAVFALLLDVTAFLIVCTAFLRYRRIQIVLDAASTTATTASFATATGDAVAVAHVPCARPHRRIRVAYHAQFICGMFNVTGLLMVGNFPEFRRGHIHYIAVMVMAVGGGLYTAIDAIITSVLCRTESYSKRSIVVFRSAAVLLTWIIAIISITGREVSESKWKAHFTNETEMERFNAQLHWNATQPGFQIHLVSTSFEWLAALMVLLYFGSLVVEFDDFSATVLLNIINQPMTINPQTQPDATSFSQQHPSPAAENIPTAEATRTAVTKAGAVVAPVDDIVIGMPT